jgi:SseB protein N-terminal domain/SseB protein C-terminal domain
MHKIALQDNVENRKKLYEALLASTLIIPTPELPQGFQGPGEKLSGPNTKIDMIGLRSKNGQKVTPAFTDTEALRTWDPNTPSLGLKSQAFFQMVMGTDIEGVMINPFDPIRKMIRPGGFVTRPESDVLAQALVPSRFGPSGFQMQLKAGKSIAIGLPAVRPGPDVDEALRTAAMGNPVITELWLFQMASPEGNSHTAVGIQIDGVIPREHEGELVAKLIESIRPILKEGQSLDFLFLRGKFGQEVRARGAPIFRRS